MPFRVKGNVDPASYPLGRQLGSCVPRQFPDVDRGHCHFRHVVAVSQLDKTIFIRWRVIPRHSPGPSRTENADPQMGIGVCSIPYPLCALGRLNAIPSEGILYPPVLISNPPPGFKDRGGSL